MFHPGRSHRALLVLLITAMLLLNSLVAYAQPARSSRHLALGNPSAAVTNTGQPANYLIARDQYALSYHRDRGIPNWVSWHLQASDLGVTQRYTGSFITDSTLPDGWYRVTHADYTNSGYDRGHMSPSADRTASEGDNQATFLLTNIVPQAPANNQGLWADLEEYARNLVRAGNEVYLVSGAVGSRGTLADGRLTIPESLWKVLLVLPAADGDDAARVTPTTQVLAIWTPNDDSVQGRTWQEYQISVRCVEQRTGLDLFSAVDRALQDAIEGAGCSTPSPANPSATPTATSRSSDRPTDIPVSTSTAEPTSTRFPTPTSTLEGSDLLLCLPGTSITLTGRTKDYSALLVYFNTRPVGGSFARRDGSYTVVLRIGSERPGLYPVEIRMRDGYTLIAQRVCQVPAATPTTTPVSGSYNNCAEDAQATAAPNYPVRITAINKSAETVTLQNVSPDPVNLGSWVMCSVRGSQRHPIDGLLAPNESRTFPGPLGNIWNNSQPDPGALYDSAGHLISYWSD